MFGKAGIGNLMKQAQQMQEKMKEAQQNLALIEVEGESGAGLVKIVATCQHAIKRVTIDNSLLSNVAEDKEMLEDLITAAINDTMHKIEATTKEKMGQFTGGLNLPAGMGDFFK